MLVICSEDEKALLLAELARVKKEKEKVDVSQFSFSFTTLMRVRVDGCVTRR